LLPDYLLGEDMRPSESRLTKTVWEVDVVIHISAQRLMTT